MVRVLFVHASPLSMMGGAEISLGHHISNKPRDVDARLVLPNQYIELSNWDIVVLANLRPSGGNGEHAEVAWTNLWLRRLRDYHGRVVRAERDIHPCAMRDARCVQTTPLERLSCTCGKRIPAAFEALYNRCDRILFLSPLHRDAINLIISIKSSQTLCAAPIDFEHFKITCSFSERKSKALIIGDHLRVGADAVDRAINAGFTFEHVAYKSVPYAAMPGLLNQYQAVVVCPAMVHAFGRIAVEAMACGCKIITNDRVGAMTWENPVDASRQANGEFWSAVLH